ncbi:tRNA adenosine(34) deaminase TadA [Hathewaya histolytica]|uniref:tRNA-specific adenosine deaminase n=1 Tax=Hathewaya histolytica TaxID=1498 RepID=A0A4U9QTN0_HATHI|nr:tRNA adenosine(34) deaminase TadA [Hathewaya histolytica]VTQ81619.1 CMP/dCMP deaminase zinc-binding protein [Hathewaya histolytica]
MVDYLTHEYFMLEALKEAEKAKSFDEVPVGAIIVKDGKIIARAHNLRETLNDPTAHAEVLAIRKASEVLNNWRLIGCSLYVTLEPCPMCAGAIIQSRISNLYIGAFDGTTGCCGSVCNITQNEYLNTFINTKWMYNNKCSEILSDFFKKKRMKR